jgi:hypothetical protein
MLDSLASRAHRIWILIEPLAKVATEMVLCVLTYNLTRVLNIVGFEKMMEAIAA